MNTPTDRELLETIAHDVQELKEQSTARGMWLDKFWNAVRSAAGQLFGEMKSAQPEAQRRKP